MADNQFFAVFGSGGSSGGGSGSVTGSGTANFVAKWSSSSALTNSLIQDNGTNLFVGSVESSTLFQLVDSSLGTNLGLVNTYSSGSAIGLSTNVNSSSTFFNYSLRLTTENSGSGGVTGLKNSTVSNGGDSTGIENRSDADASVTNLFGISSTTVVANTFTATNVSAFRVVASSGTGTATNYHGLYSEGNGITTTTTAYHIYLEAHSTGTTKYGVYQAGANDINYFNGNTGIGTTPSIDRQLAISKTTVGSNATYGIWIENSSTNDNGGANGINYGMYVNSENDGTGSAYGIYSRINNGDADATNISVVNNVTNTNTNVLGVNCLTFVSGAITNLSDIYISSPSGAGTVTNYHGLRSLGMGITNCTNAYHIYLDGHTTGTNKYGIYQAGANDLNVFKGGLQVDNQIWSTQGSDITVSANASTFNGNNGNSQKLDLASATGDITLTFTNLKAGGTYFIPVKQKSSSPVNIGTYTISGGTVKFPSGTAPTISTGASAIDTLVVYYDGTDCLVNFSLNYS